MQRMDDNFNQFISQSINKVKIKVTTAKHFKY